MTERRYNEEEVAVVLRKAAESGTVPAHARAEGLTIAQLKEIGAQVGIHPAAIEEAVRELDTPVPARSPLLGAPVTAQYERWLDGHLSPEHQTELLVAIRRAMGRHGLVTTDENGLEWRARDAFGGRYVSVVRVGDRTLVRVLGNFRDGALTIYSCLGAGGGVATLGAVKALGLAGVLGLGVVPILAVAAYVPGRIAWRWRQRREDEALRTTLESVTRAAADKLSTD